MRLKKISNYRKIKNLNYRLYNHKTKTRSLHQIKAIKQKRRSKKPGLNPNQMNQFLILLLNNLMYPQNKKNSLKINDAMKLIIFIYECSYIYKSIWKSQILNHLPISMSKIKHLESD